MKIDRTFIRGLGEQTVDCETVRSVIRRPASRRPLPPELESPTRRLV